MLCCHLVCKDSTDDRRNIVIVQFSSICFCFKRSLVVAEIISNSLVRVPVLFFHLFVHTILVLVFLFLLGEVVIRDGRS